MEKEFKALDSSVILKFIDGLLKRYDGETDYNIYITKEWLLEIKQALLKAQELESKLQRWYDLLSMDGINSNQMVKNDIQYLLKGKNNQEDIVNEKKL